METITFTAKTAYASKEDDYYLVGFADDEIETEEYIILQKAFTFDEQDIALGMDGEYAEVSGQEPYGYKCCRRAVLSDSSFVIELQSDTGDIDSVEVIFDGVCITSDLKLYLTEILGLKLVFI